MANAAVATFSLEQCGQMELRALPVLIVAAELLALDAGQLEERMAREVADNPAIAVCRRCFRCGQVSALAVCRRCRQPRPAGRDRAAAAPSARADLLVDALAGSACTLARAVEVVVASLDRHGLLTWTSPEELRRLAGCSSAQMDEALQAVRRAGPAGIATFDARTCLLAKIDEAGSRTDETWCGTSEDKSGTGDASSGTHEAGSGTDEAGSGTNEARSGTHEARSGTGEASAPAHEAGSSSSERRPGPGTGEAGADWALMRRIVDAHLAAAADGPLEPVASSLGVTVDDVDRALALLRSRLTPWPEVDLGDQASEPGPAPDIVLRRGSEGLVVEVNDPWAGAVSISEEFSDAGRGADRDARRFVTEHVARAKLLLAALDHRRTTIERVAGAVAAHHRDALVAGSAARTRLCRRDVAGALGIHESTVSRAVKHRTVRLPDGTVTDLADLFGSGHDVKAALSDLVAREAGCSDQRLANLLAARGMVVARRTVAKYRSQMGMPAAGARRPLPGPLPLVG